jgi:hypothetical protein
MRIPTLAIAAAIAAFGSSLIGASASFHGPTRQPDAFIERQHDDERGCCILKGHPDKRSWEFRDGETRESCAEMARQARMNWSFHKNRKCEAFKP